MNEMIFKSKYSDYNENEVRIMYEHNITTRLPGEDYIQFGKKILLTQLPFRYLNTIFEVDEYVQRQLDVRKRNQIRDFILNAVQKDWFYFSPFVFSARGALTQVSNGWEMPTDSKLIVIDGQHRISGLNLAIQRIQTMVSNTTMTSNNEEVEWNKKILEKLNNYPISMQIYLNLNTQQERQLFSDINTERRELHGGLIVKYDKRDQYSELVREISHDLKSEFEIEETLSRLSKQNSALTTLVGMRRCLIAMFEGDLNIKEGEESYQEVKINEIRPIAISFFRKWLEIFPLKANDRTIYVSGITTIQIVLANTVNQLKRNNNISYIEAINLLSILKSECTWKHTDPIFYAYYDKNKKRLVDFSNTTAINKFTNSFLDIIEARRGGLSI
ncbi:DNA sulfur modification protein DndB [Paenibacillus kribbensis]|uniref:DNA sulfur modification protein DndB n=1 Tax=Paenibacillus kribbensis TaxID=172713 RepID=UPI0015C0A13B|nr:DNA sulfur modification protein DndB [Paenibacillus kribbensis]